MQVEPTKSPYFAKLSEATKREKKQALKEEELRRKTGCVKGEIQSFFDAGEFLANDETKFQLKEKIRNIMTDSGEIFEKIYDDMLENYDGPNKKEEEMICEECSAPYFYDMAATKLIKERFVSKFTTIRNIKFYCRNKCFDCMKNNKEMLDDFKPYICADCDVDLDYENESTDTCERCKKVFCVLCYQKNSNIHKECRVNGEAYIKRWNDIQVEKFDSNNHRYHRYNYIQVCDECITCEEVDDYIEEEEETEELCQEQKELEETEPERRKELINALKNAGLELRKDSKYCQKYIEQDEGEIEEIVRRMAEMKYLYEFLDFQKKLDKVRAEYDEILEAGYFPDFPVFGEAEREILEETGGYPEDLMDIIKKSA